MIENSETEEDQWVDLPNEVGWFWKATRCGDEGDVIAIYVSHVLLRQFRSIGDLRGRGVKIKYLPLECPDNPLWS